MIVKSQQNRMEFSDQTCTPPSAVSERVRTLRLFTALQSLEDGTPRDVGSFNGVTVSEVQNTLMNRVVELTSIEAISSTTIR